ncbi:putative mannosyl-oligosaccharide alpha-1 [Emericellopsis cladophorae]|uniref:alpha-1,2-Mannosidase n=1 Tax=Emericellopsis cladophorae TaxID=2686198 RepID=A0A9P9Y6H4_9HYPO|nr:putative mannosyl-oligosaccharide alpha-1 [Emericellopsis cladophorae]KAI6784468.1 putative mannosyl-oligosaccharide alpha-1 [Emericellopsis cladophorae]
MGETETVEQILELVPTIKFTTTKKLKEMVSVFETNIRYIGGLLSAYDLLTGPMKDVIKDPESVECLLQQAQTLADSLSIAFDTPTGIPEGDIVLNPKPVQLPKGQNTIAGFGTLVLEWTHLSDLTGDEKYANMTQHAQAYLLDPMGVLGGFPGLLGKQVSTKTGEFLDSSGSWGASRDSFYEYLIKMYLYDPAAYSLYRDRWVLAADSTMEHLASHPSSRRELTFLSDFEGNETFPRSGHLASFAGGNFILGGIVLGERKYVDFGLALTDSHYETYRGTATRIGPEGFRWIDSDHPTGDVPKDKVKFYNENGFWPTSSSYVLRPETMESIYQAYRVTGDTKYQDLAWEAFGHIKKACRAGVGYSSIRDVNAATGGGFTDFEESFWMAETLKYLYLIFGSESEVQIQAEGANTFVFNTEAHPLRVRNRS